MADVLSKKKRKKKKNEIRRIKKDKVAGQKFLIEIRICVIFFSIILTTYNVTLFPFPIIQKLSVERYLTECS